MNFSQAMQAYSGSGQGAGGGGSALSSFLSSWAQPTGAGLSAYNQNPVPMFSQQGMQQLPTQGGVDVSGMGGLHALLMSLGLLRGQ